LWGAGLLVWCIPLPVFAPRLRPSPFVYGSRGDPALRATCWLGVEVDPALKVTGVGYVRVGRMRANVIVAIRIACPTTSW